VPTYVYACKNCGHRFEKYQSFSDDSLTVCPECNAEALRKVFNSVGIVFKGSGFYSTDSQSGSTSATKSAETSSSDSHGDGSSSDSASSSSADSSSGDSSTSSSGTPAPAAQPATSNA
jgi:putative FmdB family regulatory protein